MGMTNQHLAHKIKEYKYKFKNTSHLVGIAMTLVDFITQTWKLSW